MPQFCTQSVRRGILAVEDFYIVLSDEIAESLRPILGESLDVSMNRS
jgi:hypothetical protein